MSGTALQECRHYSSRCTMADAHGEARTKLLDLIASQLDTAMFLAKGGYNGYGLVADDLAQFRETLGRAVDGLIGAQVKLVRPEVRQKIETEKKYAEALGDDKYYWGLRAKLFAPTNRTGWQGNKKTRAEVEELYKAEPDPRDTA